MKKQLKEVIDGTKTFKAKGKMFSKWFHFTDARHLKFDLDLESTKVFNKDWGSISKLETFIEDCECGCFINYDGHMTEILLDGRVVWEKGLAPSECLFYKHTLRKLNKQHDGKLEIVWYNR